MSDSSEPGQWAYGSSASNMSETRVAEPRGFSRREYQKKTSKQSRTADNSKHCTKVSLTPKKR